MISALLKGIIIGFLLALPVGPVGVLCIRRTIAEGRRSALSTMLGAAAADMVYGIVSAFGITLVSDFVAANLDWIRIVGGGLLIFLGIGTFRAHVRTEPPKLTLNHHFGNFVSTFILTLANPLTLFAFAAVFVGAGTVDETAETLSAFALVGGVFLGSLLWFASLAAAAHAFRSLLAEKGLDIINKIAGTFIILMGIYAIGMTTIW